MNSANIHRICNHHLKPTLSFRVLREVIIFTKHVLNEKYATPAVRFELTRRTLCQSLKSDYIQGHGGRHKLKSVNSCIRYISNSTFISSMESTGTPAMPTSPVTRGWSESYPLCVARSNATLRPC